MAFNDPGISFGAFGLNGESSTNPTAIDFSKTGDPVIYVTQQNGLIYRYEIERVVDGGGNLTNTFNVVSTTLINDVQQDTQNHNDDGSNNNTTQRQITGIVTTIDADGNDVLYVSSSDWRIAVGDDSGLDTNSGQIHKVVIASADYAAANPGVNEGDVLSNVAIIRGLPRSEENHSTNGLDIGIDPVTGDTYLYVAQGGNTNKGAPGNNFSGTVDFTLSGTILKFNLTELESYDVRTDANGEEYVLDLPTLDDPSRPNVDLLSYGLTQQQIDDNPNFSLDDNGGNPDWAGGNNGLNMAKITDKVLVEVGGQLVFVDNPMTVYAPGFRNQYDVLITEAGEIYTWDNGPNGGWGGQPLSYSDGQIVDDWTSEFATNQFNESGSNGYGDQLHYLGEVSDTYGPYGGDANPIRAAKEALDAAFNSDGSYKGATTNDPIIVDGQQLFANETDARNYLANILIIYAEVGGTWTDITSNTGLPPDLYDIVSGYDWVHPGSSLDNPEDYYDGTSVMDGTAYSPESQLLNNNNDGSLYTINSSTNGLAEYTADFFGGSLSGAIIAASFNGDLTFVMPVDNDGDGRTDAVQYLGDIGGFGSSPLALTALGNDGFSSSVMIDGDGDGQDDFAGVIIAGTYGSDNVTFFVPGGDLPDPGTDADLDGASNTVDTHAGDEANGLDTRVGGNETIEWLFEPNNPSGTPTGAVKTGIGSLTGDIGLNAVWRNGTTPQINDSDPTTALFDGDFWNIGGASSFVSIDQADTGSAEGAANDQRNVIGVGFATKPGTGSLEIIALMANYFQFAPNVDNSKTWDGGEKAGIMIGGGDQTTFAQAAIAVVDDNGTIRYGLELVVEENDVPVYELIEIPGIETATEPGAGASPEIEIGFDIDLSFGAESVIAKARFEDNGVYSDWFETPALTLPDAVVAAIKGQGTSGTDPDAAGAMVGLMSTAGTGDDSFAAQWDTITINGMPQDFGSGGVVYRWNAGDSNVSAIDGGLDWIADASVVAAGSLNISTHNIGAVDGSVPTTTPIGVFAQERWDAPAAPELQLVFDANEGVVDGDYIVRLYMGNGYAGTSEAGQRVFNVDIEGQDFLTNLDLSATIGHQTGAMFEWVGTVTGGALEIDFEHVTENPLINAVEIIAVGSDTPTVSVADGTVAEDGGTFNVAISAAPFPDAADDILVDYEIRPVAGGATPEVDFTVPGATYDSGSGVYTAQGTIAGGSGDFTFPVTILDDTDEEGSEVFQVVITGVSSTGDVQIGDGTATVTITDDESPTPGAVIYRVNAGGAEIASTDSGPAWSEDQSAASAGGSANTGTPSPYLDLTAPATDTTYGATFNGSNSLGVPSALFGTERYSETANPDNMSWDFAVANGTYFVNLYFAEIWDGAQDPGDRVFDVEIEGQLALDDFDITAAYGWNNAGVEQIQVEVTDGNLDIDFLQGVQNPKISAIEIVSTGPAPDSTISIAAPTPASVQEGGDSGVTTLVFPVTFDTPPGGYVEVDYQVNVNGAISTGTLALGVVDGQISVDVPNDDIDDGSETVTVTLTGVSTGGEHAGLGATSAVGTVTEDDATGGQIVAAINAGGPALTQDGIDFSADQYFTGGQTFADGAGGNGEQPAFDGTVYETERYGGSATVPAFSYAIPVAAGSYEIDLYLAEIYQSSPGERVFDVIVEGQTILDEYDILAQNGGNINTPITLTLPGTFSPDEFGDLSALDITVSATTDNAKFSAIVVRTAGDPPATGGAATLTVNDGSNNIEVSNYGNDSFTITNTGSKNISYIEIDVSDALLPDAVFDPFGLAGDDIGKILTLNGGSDGGTGLVVPAGGFDEDAIGITYIGTGGTAGFEKLRLEFTDFNPGETISFGVDMDPNSIAGSDKGTLDSGASLAGAGLWDVGGIGGGELSGSTFTVGYADGTDSVGQLHGQGTGQQMGSEALSSQDSPDLAVTLTVNGLGEGAEGTYSAGGPQILVQGPAGETARVLVGKGFIVPFTNEFDESDPYHAQLDAQMAALEASGFPANNMVEMLYVDVLLDGTVQDISSMFDFTQVSAFDLSVPDQSNEFGELDEAQLPLGIVASVIDPATDAPKGPVTSPIHLTYSDVVEADLSLSKVVSDPTPVVGDTVVFTLTVDNAGNSEATGVTVEDILPAGFTFLGAAGDGTYDDGTGIWTIGAVVNGGSASIDIEVTVEDVAAMDQVTPIYRVNVGGPTVAAADGSALAWSGDQGNFGDAANSPYLAANSTGTTTYSGSAGSAHPGAIDMSDPSVPASAPVSVFNTERYDTSSAPEMLWQFDVAAGTLVEVTLLFAELYSGVDAAGERVFDVMMEGGLVFDDVDPFATAGAKGAFALTDRVVVGADGVLDIEFIHGVENPALKGIEIATVVPGDPTAYDNYAQILTSGIDDPDSTPGDGSVGDDDDASVSVAPVTTADLELTKTVSDPTPAFGDTVTFTLTVDHADGVDATGVSVQDLLPNGYAYVSDTGGGAYDPGTGIWTIGNVDRGGSATLEITATVNGPITPEPETVLYRVNVGGPELAAADGSALAWSQDQGALGSGTASPYRVAGSDGTPGTTAAIDITDASIPASAPEALFQSERYDAADGAEMKWEFPVTAGTVVDINLLFAETYTALPDADSSGTPAGDRIFDIEIDGVLVFDDIDQYVTAGGAFNTGFALTHRVTSDGLIDIEFLHGAFENTTVKGIEIIAINDTTPIPADYDNYAQILTADQDDPDSVAGDGSVGDDDDATVVVTASAAGENVATIAAILDASEPATDGQFLVSLEDPVAADTTITYTVAGTATNGGDYQLLTGSVVVAAGSSSAPVDVSVIDDAEFEGDETVIVTLTGVSAGDTNIAIGASDSATVTIAENDPPELTGGQLGIQVTPGAGLDASTFSGGSFILTNESAAGSGIQIASVSFDLSTGILPDIVFDPTGAGGDATASPFTPNSGAAATGLVVPGDPSSDPFSQPRNGGFDVLTIDFTDFDPGETFTFTTDIDPNSIQGVPGAGNAGAVSGYELIGSTVTVTFTDGTTQEVAVGSLVQEGVGTAATNDGGSLGGAMGRVQTEDAVAAPTLALVGGTGDQVASLPGTQTDVNGTDFMVEVTGPANGTVDILQMDSRLFIASGNPPFDVSAAELPYYANEAMAGQVVATVQLDASGVAQVPFSLLASAGGTGPDGGVNRFMAVAYEPGGSSTGAIGLTSEPLVVKLGAPLVYNSPGVMEFDGTSGSVLELPHEAGWQVDQGTVAFSFTASDTIDQQGLFSKDASFFGGGGHTTIYLNGSTLIARFQDTSTSAELTYNGIAAGEEYEIAATFGPDGVELWVDGNLVASNPLPVTWSGNAEYVQWGGRGWGGNSGAPGFDAPFNGQIADKQIYSQVLTASQIAALAASSSGTNTPPDALDDAIVVDEDGSVNFDPLANDSDLDGDPLSVSGIASGPANGTAVVEADGTVSYTPDADFNGVDSFEVTVSDGKDSVTSVVNVTVNPVNDDPDAIDDAASTVIDTPVSIDVTANDIDTDGDALDVVAVTQGTSGGSVTINPDGTVNYDPTAGFTGVETFTYTVDDGNGGTQDTATVTMTVLAAPNSPPVAVDDGVVVAEDASVTFQPGDNDTDADGDTVIAAAIASGAANGVAVVNGNGTVTYTPDADFNGSDSFDVQVTDGNGGFDVATVNVTVTPENDPPVAADDVATTDEETAVIIDLLGNDSDIDGDGLTIDSIDDPANGSVVDNGNGTITYTPDAGFSGQEMFTYTVTDGTETDTATVMVNVISFPQPVVDMPGDMLFDGTNGGVLEIPHSVVYEVPQGTLNFSFNAADTSGAQGLFSKDASGYGGGGNHFVIYLDGNTLTARFQDGANSATLTVPGIVAGQTYDVAAVFGAGGSQLYLDGTLVAASALVMDWTQNVEYIQWGGRGWGSPVGAPGFDAPFEGTISNKQLYDIRLDAGQIAELHADGPPNAAPVAVDDVLVLTEDMAVNFDPTANDSDLDGDPLTPVSVASGPANGTAVIELDGTVTYTPDADFFGTDSFDLVIGDGNGGFDTSTVDVTVNPVEDDPVAVDDAAATQEDMAVVIDVLANDDDADGDILSVVGNTDPTNGSVVYNGDGTFTYTPDAGFIGSDSFEYTLSDGDGPTDTATVTIDVTAEPVFPVPVFELGGVNTYDGSAGQVDNFAPDPALNVAEGTIAFSFIDANPGTRQGLITKDASGYAGGGNHFASYIEDGMIKARFQDGANSSVLEYAISANQEYEVAFVFSGSGAQLWIDGALVAQDPTLVMDWTSNNEYLQVGGLGWGSATGAPDFTYSFSGQIADVEVYGEALGADDIFTLAQQSSFDDI